MGVCASNQERRARLEASSPKNSFPSSRYGCVSESAHLAYTWQRQPAEPQPGPVWRRRAGGRSFCSLPPRDGGIGSHGSFAEEVDAAGQVEREGGHSQYLPTHNTEREIHLVTTATPLHVPNQHPDLFMGFPRRQHPLPKDEDRGGVAGHHPPMMPGSTPPLGGDPYPRLLGHEDSPAFSDTASTAANLAATPPIIATATPHPELPVSMARGGVASRNRGRSSWEEMERASNSPPLRSDPALTGKGPVGHEAITTATSLAPLALTTSVREGGVEMPQPIGERNTGTASEVTAMTSSSSEDLDEETTTTTIITTTIITTMQTPAVPCSTNLTAPEGYIDVPPPAGVWSYPSVDCTYTVTVYMGYGVEIQTGICFKA
ncbi:hypothetical protein AAFF_G00347850 [Aldrovandia affinis]|uniref:CUB domain-containing protein n=1 Tax=Aldrovandia affinis TaxID=143900 RepID=A0AAD7WNY2_9TELE|nr:hypothetical protein AAFF_G00347850 [Aldrovandia affinis]